MIVAVIFGVWYSLNNSRYSTRRERVPIYVTGFGAAFFIIIGYAGFQANFIQLRLDQLLEAPSTKLSIFVHWVIWADILGMAIVGISVAIKSYLHHSDKIKYPFFIVLLFTLLCFSFLLVLACWKCHWFYIETDLRNPYK